ncbi:nicotinate-nucleotide adenylyltransferase [Anaerosporobacter sp.]|uniref:nicotinate-nucleotide adenylyltransferase n=1 Tax=Anaerosporobacter sp. TaxID=1872529 RepID=UPI00286F9302|nr:nicotinate-nucleotide adenylyltransferase [Anaerosporobacter sp.]
MKKVGIMGGTFNPIHIGHLILGQTALEQFKLDKILFMPTKNPPHKKEAHILEDAVRAEMVRIAIEDNTRFELSTLELDREGTTYTADTLLQLTKQHPDEEYYFIVGADSLFYIDRWKDPETIFKLSKLVTGVRDNKSNEEMLQKIEMLNETFHTSVELLNSPNIDISSSEIRERAQKGMDIRYYVTTKVARYIQENNLYQ